MNTWDDVGTRRCPKLRGFAVAAVLLVAAVRLDAQTVLVEHPDHELLEPLVGTRASLSAVAPPSRDYRVRVVYLIPSNRQPQPDAEKILQRYLLRLQTLYRENLARLGYHQRTLPLEVSNGVPTVHFAYVPEPDTAFHDPDYGGRWSRILNAVDRAGYPPFAPGQALLVIAEIHRMLPDGSIDPATAFVGGAGTTDGQAGAAVVTGEFLARSLAELLVDDRPYDGLTIPAVGPFPLVQGVTFPAFEGTTLSSTSSSAQGASAHELAHAFGLPHDFRNDDNFNGDLLGNGLRGFRGFFHPDRYPGDDVRFSSGSARLLDSSPFFVGTAGPDLIPPEALILTGGIITPTRGLLRIAVMATDDTALATLVLLRNGSAVADAHVQGRAAVTSLEIYDYTPGAADRWQVIVVDASGNRNTSPEVPLMVPTGFNRAPVPNIRVANRRVTVGESVLLDVTRAFDPDGSSSSLQVEWDVNGDGDFDTLPSTTRTFTTAFSRPGTYQMSARISDGSGDSSVSVPIGIRVIPSLVNPLVTFEIRTPPTFSLDAARCPAQYAGTFSFDAILSNVGTQTLIEPAVEIARLTAGNLLRAGDELLEESQLFAIVNPDGTSKLSMPPGDSLTVPFTVCLEQRKPFDLLVNVRATPTD